MREFPEKWQLRLVPRPRANALAPFDVAILDSRDATTGICLGRKPKVYVGFSVINREAATAAAQKNCCHRFAVPGALARITQCLRMGAICFATS